MRFSHYLSNCLCSRDMSCWIFLVVLTTIFTTTTGDLRGKRCGPNKEFDNCGSSCQPKCGDSPEPRICPLNCVAGCFCQKGLVETASGGCVRPAQCPREHKKCDRPSEVFNQCGSACEPKCGERLPVSCTLNCVNGCFCAPGYIRLPETGECVREAECAQLVQRDDKENPCNRVRCGDCHDCKVSIYGQAVCIATHRCCKRMVHCFVDPCQDKICHRQPDAQCLSNYCGGCNTVWYNHNWEKITC